jgi:hypothetical protein
MKTYAMIDKYEVVFLIIYLLVAAGVIYAAYLLAGLFS